MGNASVNIRHRVQLIHYLLIKETHPIPAKYFLAQMFPAVIEVNGQIYLCVQASLKDCCLSPHFNYIEMMKLVRIIVCCLSVEKATLPSGMWKLKLAPSQIESNWLLELNYLLTKKSCSSSHMEGEKESTPGVLDTALLHWGIRKVFSAKLTILKAT